MNCEERVNKSIKFFIKAQKLANNNGIMLGKFLGMGCMGCVFASPDKNQVIKFTTDPNEAAYCFYVLVNDIKITPKVHSVHKLKKIWVIRQEKLLTLKDKKQKDRAIFNIFMDPKKTDKLQKLITNSTIKNVSEFLSKNSLSRHKVLCSLAHSILEHRHFRYPDIKRSNVMRKGKDYHFIDCKINDKDVEWKWYLKRIPKYES